MAPKPERRYEIREALGQGGMGVVYKAFDTLMKREVAVKTIIDVENREVLDLFYKEWAVLASIIHPNIVEIYDIGELERDGKPRPYFVMPLLPGKTLEDLIRESSHQLTVERAVEIVIQACRGLQVAHERGLVHRDIKPSNLFVMEDNSVKIIDFGIAHLVDTHSVTGMKGTLGYMSPEQILMKPPSAASDIFSLGIVAYEALTGRRPFGGGNENELARAVLQHIPPAASEINPRVSAAISQVVHKAMAKQPWHRFASAREFGDALRQALHNEPIACFDAAHLQPRIDRAAKAFQQGEVRFASEVLNELEAEGYTDPQITMLRRQIDHSVRQTTIRQLLESARRCLQEQEYPLALRKIQEALELDPEDTDALALKSRVEKQRREQKADEWSQLARQHLANCAFSQARLALQNLLELKPTDTQALHLVMEVDRCEQEYVRAQQEISQLHEAAVADWQKGQVSSALGKLERLLDLENRTRNIDPKQSGSYRTLYDQVRTEHDSIKNAFETARRHVASDNLAQAMEICDQYLAKYPGHALFQALRYDAEERERQKMSAFIAETDRKVDKEPDLDRRYSILEEALRTYPGAAHFEQALRLVRDKRELVNSIVGRAQFYEERGQFNEAVDQWKILQSVHSQYPGLEFEIERLIKRRDQQARIEAKASWVQQIDRCLESADYTRAIDAAWKALAEFPEDAELGELLKLASEGAERAAEAVALLDQGRELCAQNRFDEGIELLRKARTLDERNGAVRAVLLDSLLQQARSMLDSDWRAAEELVRQILDLDHEQVAAKSMLTLISDHKQDEFVSQCTAQARRLQASGDLENGRAVVEQGLKTYPNDPRLQQLQATLIRASQEVKRVEARRTDFEEMKRLEHHLEDKPELTPAQRDVLLRRVRTVAGQYPGDSEIQPLTALLERTLAGDEAAAVPAGGVEPAPMARPAGANLTATVLLGTRSEPGPSAPVEGVPAPAVPSAALPAPAAAATPGRALPLWDRLRTHPAIAPLRTHLAAARLGSRLGPLAANRNAMLGVIAVLVVAIVGLMSVVIGKTWQRHSRRAAAVVTVPVQVAVTPVGASIQIDGETRGTSNVSLQLAPGVHRLKATLDGYRPGYSEFAIRPGSAPPLHLALEPLPLMLRITSDLDAGQIVLDEQPAGELENGEFILNEVPGGKHTVKLAGKGGEATVAFESTPADLPGLDGPFAAKDLMAITAGSFRGTVRVQCTCGPSGVLIDGKAPAASGPNGMEWTGIGQGVHELAVGEGDKARKMTLEVGAAPALSVFLNADRNAGTLVVSTGEDDVTVFLNGKAMPRHTVMGRLRLPNLSIHAYSVRVAKDGFEAVPEQRVEIHKGEESRLEFALHPVVQMSTLEFDAGPAGAEVLVDDKSMGLVQPDGTFSASIVSGVHKVEMRKSGYVSRILSKDFPSGQPVHFSAAETALQPVTGTLQIAVAPAASVVTLRRQGEEASRAQTLNERELHLPAGMYVVSASAPKYIEQTTTVSIVAGVVRSLDIRLWPQQEAERKRVPPAGLQVLTDPAGWVAEGAWLFRQGGNFVRFRMASTAGRYNFAVLLRKGKRARWIFNRTDDRNYALFEMDKKYFYRSLVTNAGKPTEQAKTLHGAGDSGPYLIQVDVSAKAIVHSISKAGNWQQLDEWQPGGRDVSAGQFGFLIPGRDEIGVSGFAFQAK